ncbi:MAG: ribonuclease Y [Verrucomicrobia bacterium]|nr:ribonuclease Y [Verrucomicrobiota bacterium]
MKDFVVGLLTFILGIGITSLVVRLRFGTLRSLAKQLLSEAEAKAEALEAKGELKRKNQELQARQEFDAWRERYEKRLNKEEDRQKKQAEELDKRSLQLKEKEAVALKQEQLSLALESKLCAVAAMSRAEARAQLLAHIEHEASSLRQKRLQEAERQAQTEAKQIIATAIGRLAAEATASATVTTVSLPNDQLKGRIVGKEGRNVRLFERLTGVTVMLDDTPGAVVISSFDPLRKEIARQALHSLVLDGRIHASSIEVAVQEAQRNMEKELQSRGRKAALEAGIHLHSELERLLGHLHLRYSFSQNVLLHSLEVSALMGIMAAELGLNEILARRIGLLHDIGKALSHEKLGSHALLGRDLALKYGESEAVANGIGCHHGEIVPITLEGSLCSAADTLSAARPGARVEPLEASIQRMYHLEAIAQGQPGVLEAQVLQAGKELRVIVKPDQVGDEGLFELAQSITKEIEKNLPYPGQVKVLVERARRIVQFASS